MAAGAAGRGFDPSPAMPRTYKMVRVNSLPGTRRKIEGWGGANYWSLPFSIILVVPALEFARNEESNVINIRCMNFIHSRP